MTQTIPEGIQGNGNAPVYFVPETGIADINAPTVAELTADTVVKLDCYMDEGFTPNHEVSTREIQRMCLKQAAQRPGAETYSIELTGVFDGQNRIPEENEFYNTLKAGTKGYLVIAWGHDSEEPLTDASIVDIIKGEVGSRVKNQPVWDEELTVTVNWLGEDWVEDVAVGAGV